MSSPDRSPSEPKIAGEPSLAHLVTDILQDLRLLARSEFSLTKAQVSHKILEVRDEIVVVACGGLLGVAGLIISLEGLASALALWMPKWAASLGVGMMTIVVATALIKIALRRLAAGPDPSRATVASVEQDNHVVEEAS